MDGTAATCGMHTVQTHALQVIQEALSSLCVYCRDAHAYPAKCVPDWLDYTVCTSVVHTEKWPNSFFFTQTSFPSSLDFLGLVI